MDRTDTGLYIHIPFCRSKCPYCDFYSLTSRSCTDEYTDALCEEIRSLDRVGEFVGTDGKITADTVYFGGGTPSLMNASQLERILDSIHCRFDISEDAEITLECNPSSDGLGEFLMSAGRLGVNRISLGMQSSCDSERRSLGRRGNADSVKNAVLAAEKAGIENISLDVMIGVPESTVDTLRQSLDFCHSLDVKHISAYMLKLEEGTYYYKNADKLKLPSEDETADMYLFMSRYLRDRGYTHYEISNFSKDGRHSRHNMKYWEGAPYIGFGPSAHSFYNGKRFYFPDDISSFINGSRAVFDSMGGDNEEQLMLLLRTYKGISLENRTDGFMKLIKNYVSHSLGEEKDGRFVLSPEGMLVSNSIILQLTEAM